MMIAALLTTFVCERTADAMSYHRPALTICNQCRRSFGTLLNESEKPIYKTLRKLAMCT